MKKKSEYHYSKYFKERHKEFALKTLEIMNQEECADLDSIIVENLKNNRFMICDQDEDMLIPMEDDPEFMQHCNALADNYNITTYYGFRSKEFGTPAFLAVIEDCSGDDVVMVHDPDFHDTEAGIVYISKSGEPEYTVRKVLFEHGMIKLASSERPYEETHLEAKFNKLYRAWRKDSALKKSSQNPGYVYCDAYERRHKEFALSVFEMMNEDENANLDPILIDNLEKDKFMICDHDQNKLIPMEEDPEFMDICNSMARDYDTTCYYGFRYKKFGTPAFLAVSEGYGDGVVMTPSSSSFGLCAGMFYINKDGEVDYTINNIKFENGMIKLASSERPYEETHPEDR